MHSKPLSARPAILDKFLTDSTYAYVLISEDASEAEIYNAIVKFEEDGFEFFDIFMNYTIMRKMKVVLS